MSNFIASIITIASASPIAIVAVAEFVGAIPNGQASAPHGIGSVKSLALASVESGLPVTATTFSPSENVTREQMAAILCRYAQYKRYDTTASAALSAFSDAAAVSTYAKAPLSWAVAEKLVNGTDGKLLPRASATRAQVAAILHRFVENITK